MGIRRNVLRAAGACAAAGMITCALAGTALAADVIPVQTSIQQESGDVIVNVIDFSGTAGETVFLTVEQGGNKVANMLPHTLGQTDEGEDVQEGEAADMFAIQPGSVADLEAMLSDGGGLKVTVYADRAGKTELYSAQVFGVYAELASTDGDELTRQLIGTHTGEGGFAAPEQLFAGGQAYKLTGDKTQTGGELVFAYEPYSAASTVDGSIRYVDVKTGKALSYFTPIPGLEKGQDKTVDIPEIVESDGTIYRNMSFETQVVANNPEATSFTIPVIALSAEQIKAAGYYVATINMVDAESGDAIVTDKVYVRGDVTYTAPSVIYKSVGKDAITYEIADASGQVLQLSPAADAAEVVDGARTITIGYNAVPADEKEITVTFNLKDGSVRDRAADKEKRNIGTDTKTVTAENPTALPPETYEANGTKYVLAGDADIYKYTFGSGDVPSIDVYYLPEGYEQETLESYEVTVNYVDFYSQEIVDSEKFTSDPVLYNGEDIMGIVTFTPPARFEANGKTYLKLDGQDTIEHNYFSNFGTYTIYYRDSAQQLESVPTITNVRVEYIDGGTTTTTAGTATAAGAATTDAGTATTAAQLNAGQTYNAPQGAGTAATATAQDGRDALQERIDDDETALSSGLENAADEKAQAGIPIAPIVGGIIAAVVVIIAVLAATFGRRENQDRR